MIPSIQSLVWHMICCTFLLCVLEAAKWLHLVSSTSNPTFFSDKSNTLLTAFDFKVIPALLCPLVGPSVASRLACGRQLLPCLGNGFYSLLPGRMPTHCSTMSLLRLFHIASLSLCLPLVNNPCRHLFGSYYYYYNLVYINPCHIPYVKGH